MKHPFQSVPTDSSNIIPPHHKTVKTMRNYKLATLFIIAIVFSPHLIIVKGQTLTLASLDAQYEQGDDISISGTSTAVANLTLIIVFNSTTLYERNFIADTDGNYSEEYVIPVNATEGVYMVTVSGGGESVSADFTVFSDDSEESEEADLVEDNSTELAETLIEQAEDLKEKVEDAFDDLEDEEAPNEANSSYLQGIEYLNMAKEALEEGNYIEASDMAFEAIQLFGNAFEEVSALQPQVEPAAGVDDGPEGSQSLNGISAALERARVYWLKLDTALGRFEDNGYYVSEVRRVLGDAWIALEDSRVHVEAGDFAAAREDFLRARRVLGRINGLMNSSMKERKAKQAEKFLEQFDMRVRKISDTVDGLQGNLAASKVKKVKDVLESTAETLLNISGSFSSGNMTDIIEDLDDAVEDLEDGLDELNGEGLSKWIKMVYRFEARIESFNESLQRMANAGYNTTELDDYLSEAQSLLSLMEVKVREGDEEAVEGLVEYAESLVEDIQGLFKKLQRNSISASQVTGATRGRSEEPGPVDIDGEGGNVTVSSISGSYELSEDLEELESVISRIEAWLANSSTSIDNATDIGTLVEGAKAFIEDAKVLADENPGEAKELIEAAEELLDEAMDLIEGITETESTVSTTTSNPRPRKNDKNSYDS
jgi:tetratricopeptide (TPR) repeat protein